MIQCSGFSGRAWIFHDKIVCTATHPDQPNWSGHSRGRKIHLAKDNKKTVCNMLVDEGLPEEDHNWSMVHNGRCKVCFRGLPEFTEKDLWPESECDHPGGKDEPNRET